MPAAMPGISPGLWMNHAVGAETRKHFFLCAVSLDSGAQKLATPFPRQLRAGASLHANAQCGDEISTC